jgi:hypothetical protein
MRYYKNSTTLFFSLNETVHPDDACICDYGYEDMQYCECPKNPRVSALFVMVSARGNPVRTNPTQTTYIIRVFSTNCLQKEVEESLFDDMDPFLQFAIEFVDRSSDINKCYVKDLKKYLSNMGEITINPYVGKNLGKASMDAYISSFFDLLNQTIKAPVEDVKSECAHIKKRSKAS